MSDQVLGDLRDRLGVVLPTVYTGPLLTLTRDRLSAYLDRVRANPNLGANTAAGITSLTVGWPDIEGSHATIHGASSVWLIGEHWENGALTNDRSESDYHYTAGLDKVDGRWLVSSWDDQQIR